jgi:hypothetical protein
LKSYFTTWLLLMRPILFLLVVSFCSDFFFACVTDSLHWLGSWCQG